MDTPSQPTPSQPTPSQPTPSQPTPSQPSEEPFAEGEEVAKKLQQTLGMGNEILTRAKAIARAAEQRTKKLIGQSPPPPSESPADNAPPPSS